MTQGDDENYELPSRGTLQRMKEDQRTGKELDKQLTGLAASAQLKAHMAETSRARLPAGARHDMSPGHPCSFFLLLAQDLAIANC